MKAKLLNIILVFLFLFPLFISADVRLEQEYPEISGSEMTQEVITKDTTLPKLIRYYSTWAIIIAILISVGSLIAGGVQYLVSAGRVSVTQKARARIQNSFLGLAILLMSYSILHVVNPQMDIIYVEKVPIETGIVLLSRTALYGSADEAINDAVKGGLMNGNPSLATLEELGYAKYLTDQVVSLKEVIGKDFFTTARNDSGVPLKVTFERFEPAAVAFWGRDSDNFKLVAYSEESLQGEKKEYTSKGKLNEQNIPLGNVIEKGANPPMKIVIIDPYDPADPTAPFNPDNSDYFQSFIEFKDEQQGTNNYNVYHPPLSFQKEGIGAGIYFYAEDGSHRYVTGAVINLNAGNIDFGDQASKIEIKNKDPQTGERHNYLVILHEDSSFQGNLRVFFEKEKESNFLSILFRQLSFYVTNIFTETAASMHLGNVTKNEYYEGQYPGGAFRIDSAEYEIGNVPEPDPANPGSSRVNVLGADQYGKLDLLTSVQVFELASRSACREVMLCNEEYFQGMCISFNPRGKKIIGRYRHVFLPMPWYYPVAIPELIIGQYEAQAGEMKDIDSKFNKFLFNIKSMRIEGSCLVLLYDAPAKEVPDCVEEMSKTSPDAKKCWNLDYFNSNSGIFTEREYPVLKNFPVGYCTGGWKNFKAREPQSCVSSIAVFPIKQ